MNKGFTQRLAVFLLCAPSVVLANASKNIATPHINDVYTPTEIPRITSKIVVDGKIDESSWGKARRFLVNNVTFPHENVLAPVQTEAFMMEDGDTLYVAFKAYDPEPTKIRAFLRDRDKNWNDDLVGLKIDSFNDDTLAYQFFINPLGTQTDSIENALTGRESSAWNGIWDSAGQITDFGYTVEIAIPLRILNFNDRLDIQQWGYELVRFYPRDERLRISNAKMDQGNECWVCQMPTIEGFKGAKQGKNLTLVPTLVSGTTETRDISTNGNTVVLGEWESESNTDVGLDLKWGITPDVTLNATLNPDFSQVEADSGQLNVNNTFALFTPERRSFFLANEDYFSTPINLVYTRNIQDPDYGGKITGKVDDHSFGAFVADDKTALFLLPGNLGSNVFEVEEKTTNGAFRYNYTVNDDLNVGATTTLRKNDSYHNYLTSVDTRYQPNQNNRLNVQLLSSDTYLSQNYVDEIKNSGDYSSEQSLRAEQINGSDIAYRVHYNHMNRDWFFNATHMNIGENFRADLAFFNNTDHQKTVLGGGRIWRGNDDNWWTRMQLAGDVDWTYNQNGEKIEQEAELYLNVNGPKQSFFRHGFSTRTKVGNRIDESSLQIEGNTEEFDEYEFTSWLEFKPNSHIWVGNFFKLGKGIDYSNSRLSDVMVWEPKVTWHLNKHMETRLAFTFSNMHYNSKEIYTANLIDFRLSYQFSIRSFLRLSIVGYDINRQLENYDPLVQEELRDDFNSQFKSVSTQLLFSYKVNPQTLFFVGYSDGGYQDDDLTRLTKDTRSVFLKMSYAWMM